MRFTVECYENPNAFRGFWDAENASDIYNDPLRHAMTLTVDEESAEDAAHEAFHIANAPWPVTDANGAEWPHFNTRSMSSGDVVFVDTPDGNVAYLCLSIGWHRVRGDFLQLAVGEAR